MSTLARLRRLLGHEHAETLEAHLYFTLCFLVSLGGLLALSINIALDHFLSDILISGGIMATGSLFSFVGRRIESPERLGALVIILVGIAVAATWFTNAGISGTSVPWFAPLIVVTSVMLRGTSRLLTLAALLSLIVGCALIEFFRPDLITGHSDPTYEFLDKLLVFIATSVVLALVAVMLTHAYRRERERVAELVASKVRAELEIQQRQTEIEALRDLLPICAHCHQIRDEQNDWHGLEAYMQKHRSTDFSHSICPSCAATHFT